MQGAPIPAMMQQPQMIDPIPQGVKLGTPGAGVQLGLPYRPCPGHIWYANGKICDAEGCNNPAYKDCDDKIHFCCMPIWTGCGKVMCVTHMNVNVKKSEMGTEKKKVYYSISLYYCKINPRC